MECPPGNVIGHVEQNLNIYRPSFDICDANGDTKYVIEGPSSCKTRCTYFFIVLLRLIEFCLVGFSSSFFATTYIFIYTYTSMT